jgi:hypothetical protein
MPKKKKTGAAPHAKPVTKTAFVLALPKTMSAKEVIAKGKASGVSLSAAHVYAIRSGSKKKGHAQRDAAGHARATHAVGKHGAEDLLKAAAAELGLSNAMAILKAEHDKVHRLLGG